MASYSGYRDIDLVGGRRRKSKKNSKKSRNGSRKGSRKRSRSNKKDDIYDSFTKDILKELDATSQYKSLPQMANPMNNPNFNPTFNPMVNSMGQGIDPSSIDPLHLNYMLTPNEQNKTNDVKLGISYEQMMNVQSMPNMLNNMSTGMNNLK
jgi:hypothetical protein